VRARGRKRHKRRRGEGGGRRRKSGLVAVSDAVPESQKRRVGWGCRRSCGRRRRRRSESGLVAVSDAVPVRTGLETIYELSKEYNSKFLAGTHTLFEFELIKPESCAAFARAICAFTCFHIHEIRPFCDFRTFQIITFKHSKVHISKKLNGTHTMLDFNLNKHVIQHRFVPSVSSYAFLFSPTRSQILFICHTL